MAGDAAGQPPVITLINPATGATFDFRGRWLRSSPATDRDIKAGRAKFRGDKVWLDLPPGVQAQVDKGTLERVRDGELSAAGPWPDDEAPWIPNGMPMPPGNAPHTAWRDYAVGQGVPAAEASARTRDQLRIMFLAPGVGRDDMPDVEILDADPGGRAARRR
jgi:hypothetical protein